MSAICLHTPTLGKCATRRRCNISGYHCHVLVSHPSSLPPFLQLSLRPSVRPSFPPCLPACLPTISPTPSTLPASLPPSLPPSLLTTLTHSLPPSLPPPSLPASLPPCLPLSLSSYHSPSLLTTLTHSLPPSLPPPSLPASLPPCLPASLPTPSLLVLLRVLLPVFRELPLLVVDDGSQQLQAADVELLLRDPLHLRRRPATQLGRDPTTTTARQSGKQSAKTPAAPNSLPSRELGNTKRNNSWC